MPIRRGSSGNPDAKAEAYLQYYLYQLDKHLRDDEILYLKIHPSARKNIKFNTFTHIKNCPQNYVTYDVLNCGDVLVTDYSSIMYDFALTRKKIVLFTFDE